jgi:hypothetical protein
MQTQGGAAAEAAIVSGERRFHVRLLADWNDNGLYDHALSDLSGFVKSVTTDRSLKGGLPADITLIQGSGAAEIDIQLSGEYNGLPFVSVFSPYQTLSPFWNSTPVGTEIKYEIGVEVLDGTIYWYPQFVGNIRTVTPDRGSGYVNVTALDRVEMLRRPVMFPAWAVYEYHVSRGVVQSLLTDTQWVIDHCLRECKVSPTPLRPTSREENGLSETDVTGPQIWINGTGGWLPSIGWCDNWNVVEFPDTESTGIPMYMTSGAVHPSSPEPTTKPLAFHAMQTAGNDHSKYWCTNRDQMTPQGIQVLGCTLITSGANGTYYQTADKFELLQVRIGSTYVISVWLEDGQIWSEHLDETLAIVKTSSKVNIPTTEPFVQCNIVWDAFNAAGPLVYVSAGVNTNNAGNYEDLGAVYTHIGGRTDELKGLFTVRRQVALNDIRYSSTNFGNLTVAQSLTWGYRSASYVAVLDQGSNGISYIPQRKADDAWNIISDVASSEFGAVFWDENGVFRFWNSARLGSLKSTIVREMSLDDVTGLRITNTLDSVRNIWSVDAGKRIAPQGVTFEASSVDEFYVPGGTERFFRLWEDSVLSPNPGKLPRYSSVAGTFPEWTDDVIQGYVAQWWNGSDWAEDEGKISGIDIYSYFDNEGRLVVKIWNGYAEDMRLATNNDQPAMRIEGTAIHTKDNQVTVTKDLNSIAKWKGRNIRLSGDWYQEHYNYKGMVNTLIQSTKEPTPTTDAITIAGDPRLQFGDTVRINDKYGLGESFNIQIYGIRRTFDVDTGLTDNLTVQLIAPGGIWDDATYGIWEQTFVWGP